MGPPSKAPWPLRSAGVPPGLAQQHHCVSLLLPEHFFQEEMFDAISS
jgi:hypothetical protein